MLAAQPEKFRCMEIIGFQIQQHKILKVLIELFNLILFP